MDMYFGSSVFLRGQNLADSQGQRPRRRRCEPLEKHQEWGTQPPQGPPVEVHIFDSEGRKKKTTVKDTSQALRGLERYFNRY